MQAEYGERSQAERVREEIEEWLADRGLPWFELSMDLFEKPHPRRAEQVEALVRRADVVVSMRLHRLVLGLKHEPPVIACDPIEGGAKVSGQAEALGWPLVLRPSTSVRRHSTRPWSAACRARWAASCSRPAPAARPAPRRPAPGSPTS